MSERALLRRRAALTQGQLARRVGICAPKLCLWERGEVQLEPRVVARIAECLHQALGETPSFSDSLELARALDSTQFASEAA